MRKNLLLLLLMISMPVYSEVVSTNNSIILSANTNTGGAVIIESSNNGPISTQNNVQQQAIETVKLNTNTIVQPTLQPIQSNQIQTIHTQQPQQIQQKQQPQQVVQPNPLTISQNIPFANCNKIFAVNREKLFYLTLASLSANKFLIDEVQTYNGYIIFSVNHNRYLATIASVDGENSILKITPCNNIYYFPVGILLNTFKYIDINLNNEIKNG